MALSVFLTKNSSKYAYSKPYYKHLRKAPHICVLRNLDKKQTLINTLKYDRHNVGFLEMMYEYLSPDVNMACSAGRLDDVKAFPEISTSMMYSACMGGHMNIINLMISLGATDYNMGAYGACKGGNKVIAVIMVLYGGNPSWAWRGCFGANKFSLHMVEYMESLST